MRKVGINVEPNVLYGVDSFLTCAAHTGFESVFSNCEEEDFVKRVSARCSGPPRGRRS